MSLTNLLVPTFRQMLGTLSGLLQKAGEQRREDAASLLGARLAPDMFPLAMQIVFATRQAEEAVSRLQGRSVAPRASEAPDTIAAAQAGLADILGMLDALPTDALDAGGDLPISMDLPGGIAFDMTGEQYARDWALPQFYFHLVTAYAILRSQGVDIGKADYVPYMMAYLRRDARAVK